MHAVSLPGADMAARPPEMLQLTAAVGQLRETQTGLEATYVLRSPDPSLEVAMTSAQLELIPCDTRKGRREVLKVPKLESAPSRGGVLKGSVPLSAESISPHVCGLLYRFEGVAARPGAVTRAEIRATTAAPPPTRKPIPARATVYIPVRRQARLTRGTSADMGGFLRSLIDSKLLPDDTTTITMDDLRTLQRAGKIRRDGASWRVVK